MFFKKIVKMGWLLKSQRISNLSDIPVGIFQKVFRFLKHFFFNNLCGSKVGYRFYRRIQVIHMNVQMAGKISRCSQYQRVCR